MSVERYNPNAPVEASKKVKRSFIEQAGVPAGLLATVGAAMVFEPLPIVKAIVGLVVGYSTYRAIMAGFGRP